MPPISLEELTMRTTQQPPAGTNPGIRRRLTRPPVIIALAVLAVAAVVVTLTVFQPQTYFIDERVDEAAPTAQDASEAAEPAGEAEPAAGDDPAEAAEAEASENAAGADEASEDAAGEAEASEEPAAPAEPEEAAEPAVLGQGSFHGLDHQAEGDAILLQLDDGQQVLRLEDLDVQNGPDLYVYLSAAPADGPASAHTDRFVDLGTLKGNQGNQNYEIPADVDASEFQSAVIWCKRFAVGFAAAPLT